MAKSLFPWPMSLIHCNDHYDRILCYRRGERREEREQGAGSREQGAGSREQGAGGREQGGREQGGREQGGREQGAGSRQKGEEKEGTGRREECINIIYK